MFIEPYLFFNGRCEEAIAFYRTTLGAELKALLRFKENPSPEHNPPGSDEKVMHALMRIGESNVMLSDGNCGGATKFDGVSLVLNPATDDEADSVFAALADEGKIQMPMGATFFASKFGMVTDKFGLLWMVIRALPQ